MRFISSISLVVLIAGVSTVTAQDRIAAKGRNPGLLDRPARLTVDSVRLIDALNLLRERSGVPVAFSPDFIPLAHRVTCQCENVTVRAALGVLLAGIELVVAEYERQIVIEPAGDHDPVKRYAASLKVPSPAVIAVGREDLPRSQPVLVPVPPATDWQGGPVAGSVIGSRGQLLLGARVTLRPAAADGAVRTTTTDGAGRFRFPGVVGAQANVDVAAIGYRPTTTVVRVGDEAVRIVLSEVAVNLDEVIVTGTAGAAQKREIGNAVTSVDVGDVVSVAPVRNVEQVLTGRAAGVVVSSATGTAGSGSRILIRGPASLSFDGNPIIYVDGVRVNNDVLRGPPGQAAVGPIRAAAVSRINDFAPDQIESIEVIKGPAAATLYGTEASNGVIQIITKKGRAGRPILNTRVKEGTSSITDPERRFPWRYSKNPTTGVVDSMNSFVDARAFGLALARTGWLQGYGADLAGGTDAARYNIGGDFDREEGTMPNNLVNRFTGHANVTLAPVPSVDIDAALGLAVSGSQFPGQSYMQTLFRPNPAVRSGPTRGYPTMPPEVDLATREFSQNLNRFTGSVKIQHRPFSWLSQRLTVGSDLTNEQNTSLFPLVPDQYTQFFSAAGRLGSKSIARKDATYTTVDYAGTASFNLRKSVRSSTSFGAQYYRKVDHFESLDGQQFPAAGVTAVAGAAIRSSSEDIIENTTVGLYVQQQLSLNGRLFVTGAIRADDNSAFGATFDLVTYPKISASWVVSEEPFWHVGFVNTLRLRSAYGQSGQQPASFAAIRTYLPIAGAGDVASGTPQFVGNPDLGPERGRELEIGFEAGLFNDRLGIDFTYYNHRTKDAIVASNVAPSTGFPGIKFVNAGEVQNKGIEFMIRGRPLDTRPVDWDLSFNLATNDNEVVSLGIPGITFIATGFLPNRHQPGYPIGAYFQRRIVSAALDATGRAINVMCDPGPGGTAPLPCAQAPQVFIGPNVPKAFGAVSSTFTLFDRLRVYASLDFKLGHYLFEAQRLIGCLGGRSAITNFPERYDPAEVAECQMGLGFVHDGLIQKDSYAKLREISVSYSLPSRLARMLKAHSGLVSLAARNIKTFTGWDGLDPEVFVSDGFLVGGHNQDVLPMPFVFTGSLRLSF